MSDASVQSACSAGCLPTPFTYARRTIFGLAVALLTLGATTSANAAVLYDFSLAANGDLGAVHVVLKTDKFLAAPGLQVFPVGDPILEVVSAGTPIDPSSVVGFEAFPTTTRFGLALFKPGSGSVLFNVGIPTTSLCSSGRPTRPGRSSPFPGWS
jgi:hypothetical protein